MRISISICLFWLSVFSFGQKSAYKIGQVDRKFWDMTECPIDKDAGAFVIMDYGQTLFNPQLKVQFIHHVQIKILNSSEFERADVTIPYVTGGEVQGLRAVTYNYVDGKLVESKLGKDAIFKEKVEGKYYHLKFTMPNVKEGSIIEYSYKVEHGDYENLNTWYFQRGVPVLKSEYELNIPEYFDYQRIMTGYVPLTKSTISRTNGLLGNTNILFNKHQYEAINVPAFKDEAYLACEDDHISKIQFELRRFTVPGSVDKIFLTNNYNDLAKKLYESDYWQGRIKEAKWAREEMDVVLGEDAKGEPLTVARKIYDYVKSFERGEVVGNDKSLRKNFKEKKGSAIETNMVLAAILNQYSDIGMRADLVLLSTRSHGLLHPIYPMYSRFNHAIVRLRIANEELLLDASNKQHVFGVLPGKCVNDKGMVVGPTAEWVKLTPYQSTGKVIYAQLELDGEGILKGDLTVRRKGYEAWDFDAVLRKKTPEVYKEDYAKGKSTWDIVQHELDDMSDEFTNQERVSGRFEGQAEAVGNLLYLNPVIFDRYVNNPFNSEKRLYPVQFIAPYTDTYSCKIKLPENYTIESLPQPLNAALRDRGIVVTYSVSSLGNEININQRFQLTKTDFTPEEYHQLRELFAQIVQKHGEQIVLKRI
jgi:hypothetical protein